MIFQVEVNNRG